MAGASDETAEARAEDDEATADDEEARAEDEDARAEEAELRAELEDEAVLTGAVVVAGPRLKIAMSAMMTITATMMMIQVLRFMGKALCWRESTGKNVV